MVGNYIAFEEFATSAKTNKIYDTAIKGNCVNAFQTLKQAGSFDNADGIAADRFTDADGVNNTVNTGSTTATYDATNDYYEGIAEGAAESVSDSITSGSATAVTGFTATVNCLADGYINRVVFRTGTNTASDGNFEIALQKNGVEVASKTQFVTASTTYTVNFVKADYSEFFENGDTISIVFTRLSGGRLVVRSSVPTQYDGTDFNVPIQSDFMYINLAGTVMQFTDIQTTTQIVCDANLPNLDGTENGTLVYGDTDNFIYTATGNATDVDDSHAVSLGTTSSVTTKDGVKVMSKTDSVFTECTKSSTSTATEAYLYDSTEQLLDQATFSGDVATFTGGYVLKAGVEYYIVADNGGSSYTRTTDASSDLFPISGTNVLYIAGTSDFTDTANDIYNIETVTTQGVSGSQTQVTNITASISDGATTVSNITLGEINLLSGLSVGKTTLTFNTTTSNAKITPKLRGYSFNLIK